MKKNIFLLLFIGFRFFSNAQNVSIDELRRDYYRINSDSIICYKLYDKVSKTNSDNNDILAYKGAITTAMAGHSTNKAEKIKLFTTGKKLLEQSIAKDSTNAELRFLRFTVQSNCPKALGYNKQLTNDKNFIVNNFSSIKSAVLKKKMSSFLLESNYLSESDKQKIKTAIN